MPKISPQALTYMEQMWTEANLLSGPEYIVGWMVRREFHIHDRHGALKYSYGGLSLQLCGFKEGTDQWVCVRVGSFQFFILSEEVDAFETKTIELEEIDDLTGCDTMKVLAVR